jgi:hypothetical protein
MCLWWSQEKINYWFVMYMYGAVYRWQIKCSGMRRRLERATLTSRKCDTMCIATRCTASTRKHPMHWEELSRKEEKMSGRGGRHATSLWWTLQHAKGGTLTPFSMHIPVYPFGMFQPNFVNFVTLSETMPQLPALCLCLVGVGLMITCPSI